MLTMLVAAAYALAHGSNTFVLIGSFGVMTGVAFAIWWVYRCSQRPLRILLLSLPWIVLSFPVVFLFGKPLYAELIAKKFLNSVRDVQISYQALPQPNPRVFGQIHIQYRVPAESTIDMPDFQDYVHDNLTSTHPRISFPEPVFLWHASGAIFPVSVLPLNTMSVDGVTVDKDKGTLFFRRGGKYVLTYDIGIWNVQRLRAKDGIPNEPAKYCIDTTDRERVLKTLDSGTYGIEAELYKPLSVSIISRYDLANRMRGGQVLLSTMTLPLSKHDMLEAARKHLKSLSLPACTTD